MAEELAAISEDSDEEATKSCALKIKLRLRGAGAFTAPAVTAISEVKMEALTPAACRALQVGDERTLRWHRAHLTAEEHLTRGRFRLPMP